MRNILIVAGGLVAVAAIALGVYFGTRPAPTGPAPTAAVASKSSILTVLPDDRVEGDPKAPITMIEYASFTCPHCAHFAVTELPVIKKKWIDTGKVKLVYRHFPLDETAAKVAQIVNCAPKEKYYPLVDMVFRGQANWAVASDPIAELSKSLRIAGIGENDIKACLANQAGADAVVASYRSGDQAGVNSTPTIFINGEQFKGARTVVCDGTLGDDFCSINPTGGPELATGGSGDVLSGVIGALLAQGVAPAEAARAAVWVHGAAGDQLGRGMISSDLPHAIAGALRRIAVSTDPRS